MCFVFLYKSLPLFYFTFDQFIFQDFNRETPFVHEPWDQPQAWHRGVSVLTNRKSKCNFGLMSPYSWYPSVSWDYGFALWLKWTHQSLLWLHNPIGSGNLFRNVCRCNSWCPFRVLSLPFLVSSDLPSQLTTRQMSFPCSQPVSN